VKAKVICLCLAILSCALMAWTQGTGKISGKVVDVSGSPVAGASITMTDLTSGAVARAKTAANGQFSASGLAPDRYLVTVEKTGFNAFIERVSLATQQSVNIQATLTVETLAQSVVVRGTVVPGATPQPTRSQVFLSDQTIRVLDRKQLDAAGPVAGGAQMISYTPGASVTGYGNTGATKYTIMLNGVTQGWGGYGGFTAPGSLGVTFDGVPIVDVATGLWQSATMPQNLLMQNLTVTYGPGDPSKRWYTNVGGQVEFTPVQPTVSRHMSVSASYGSFNQKNIAFVLSTGGFHGWSSVIAGGLGNGDSFRSAPDGFNNPSKDGAVFGKTVRMFSSGSFELGGYYAKSGGFRSQVIPATDQGIMYNGQDYSQATSGFYSTLPHDAYNKYDTNLMWLLFARENLLMNSTTTLTNQTWYMHIRRLHDRMNDIFAGPGQTNEWNNPYSDAFGDELGIQKVLPLNTVNVGAYYIHELYNSHNNFYDPTMGGDGPHRLVNIGAKIRSSYFNQDDVALYAQDTFHPIPQIRITPGIRYVGFQTGYSDNAARDFIFAPGVVLSSHCSLYPSGSDPYNNIFGSPNTKDQGSICASHESRTGVEPSINVAVTPLSWLSIYGGYDVEYRSPSMGGGGGMFQGVDPASYTLAKGAYSQVGVKVHFTNAPAMKNVIFGLNYYHLDYKNQEIDIELSNGDQISSSGSSTYHGVNAYFDDDPAFNLHVFANFTGEASRYTSYVLNAPVGTPCTASGVTCFNDLPVPYVPNTTLNAGAYYGISRHEHVLIEPRFWIKYMGSQHLFDNMAGLPSNQTMPAYTTANLSFTAPIKKYVNLSVSLLNLFNNKYNEYEWISSGGYFGTPNGGYVLAYPGAPLSTYGTISFQF
jgi:iron complex outermembrane receptor protein